MSISTFALCGAFALLVLLIFLTSKKTYDLYCGTCRYKFDTEEVEIYLASEDDGLSFRFYDACDCPHCGCQNIIGRRLDREEVDK